MLDVPNNFNKIYTNKLRERRAKLTLSSSSSRSYLPGCVKLPFESFILQELSRDQVLSLTKSQWYRFFHREYFRGKHVVFIMRLYNTCAHFVEIAFHAMQCITLICFHKCNNRCIFYYVFISNFLICL